MRYGTASYTAKGIAVHRAIESEKPVEERVCYDPLARAFVGEEFTACGQVMLPPWMALWLFQIGLPGFHEYFVLRTRFFDDYLIECLAGGTRQIVILGAGYDSRAYRIERIGHDVPVFEVDHPATQQEKLAKLREIIGDLPQNVVYVPIDFNTQQLAARLFESGFDARLKTLFLWEGVTYYLAVEAVDTVLTFVGQHAGPASSIIFDYTFPDVIAGANTRIEAVNWRIYVGRYGEKLTFGIAPEDICSFLSKRGFTKVCSKTGKQLENLYFTGVNRNREASPIFRVAWATVDEREKGEERCIDLF